MINQSPDLPNHDLRERELPLESLLLDPNNYRFQDDPSYQPAEPSRFHEASVQERAYRRLRAESLIDLKKSIITNGFLRFERIVVRRYGPSDPTDLYLVVEGNRRIAALRWIREDHAAGISAPTDVLTALENVPVIVIESEDEATYLALMAVRHVGGIKEWGGYQRAKLVAELCDAFRLSRSEIADRIGMSVNEVNRRYRAFKALRQMEQDEEYGDLAEPSMYPLFHEALSLPIVREWLGWSDEVSQFLDRSQTEQFYELIAPLQRGDGVPAEPKITTFSQVRLLRSILGNPDAKRILLDPDRTFTEASATAKAEEMSKSWASSVAEAVGALNSVSALELRSLSPEEVDAIERLESVAHQLLDTYHKLTSA